MVVFLEPGLLLRKLNSKPHIFSWKSIFYGNYFYAVCAVALSIESVFQAQAIVPQLLFFVLEFLAVLFFYNKAYLVTEEELAAENERQAWYKTHHTFLKRLQVVLLGSLLLIGLFVLFQNFERIKHVTVTMWLLVFIFPAVAFLYYGFTLFGKAIKLRTFGWLKPLIIGVSWAGLCTIYPVLYSAIITGNPFSLDSTLWFLFIKNVFFIGILALLFDIKDYATDLNYQLKTIVVKLGVARTIYFLVLPICLAAWFAFLVYARFNNFSWPRIALNTLPFSAVFVLALSLHKKKSILYYLSVIDGILLLKALCGVLASLLFYSSK